MRFYFQSLLFVSIAFLGSCSKDKTKNDQFIIGSSDAGNVIVRSYNPALTIASNSNGGLKTDTIDLFNDGVKDFVIMAYGFHWANLRWSNIVSLNDKVEILSTQIIDTIMLSAQNANPLVNYDSVSYNTYSGFDSGQLNDVAISTSMDYYPRQFEYGASVYINNSTNVWHNTVVLSNYANGIHYSSPNLFHYIRKGNWNNVGVKYLCFKLEQDDQTKYGWIKLEVNYELSVRVLEYAIQD